MSSAALPLSDDPGHPILQTIADDDGMPTPGVPLEEARKHYFNVGRSALRCVRLALASAGRSSVGKILDLPCGHGRVMRTLRAAYPQAQIHACDLQTAGVEFCRSQLNAVPIPSDPDPKKIRLKGPYDLIWSGSLFTHFEASRWPAFLQLLHESLAVGGVCVVTAHGRRAAELIRNGTTDYGLSHPGRLLTPFDRDGFSYQTYDPSGSYGVSLSAVPWVATQLGHLKNARFVLMLERGWADHQDVYAWQRVDW